jgi:hypothetical protein
MNKVMVTKKDTMMQQSLLQREEYGHFKDPLSIFLSLNLDSRITDQASLRSFYYINFYGRSCVCRDKEDFITVTIEQV